MKNLDKTYLPVDQAVSATLISKLKLCLVTSVQADFTVYSKFIRKVILGGITMVQLRAKEQNIAHIREKALFLKAHLQPFGIPLIINDLVELAAEIDADGVHLGQEDMPIHHARKILGKHKIIGLSIESFDELHHANNQPDISYVSASAIFPSLTKSDCKKIWGMDQFTKLAAKSLHPITAIGGINIHNASKVFNAGACGIAVADAIHNTQDPYLATRTLLQSAN